MKKYKEVLSRVKTIIDDNELIDKILSTYPDRAHENREEFIKNREIRIKKVLNLAKPKQTMSFMRRLYRRVMEDFQ